MKDKNGILHVVIEKKNKCKETVIYAIGNVDKEIAAKMIEFLISEFPGVMEKVEK